MAVVVCLAIVWGVQPVFALTKSPPVTTPQPKVSASYKKRAYVQHAYRAAGIPQIIEFSLDSHLSRTGVIVTDADSGAVQALQQRSQTVTSLPKPLIKVNGKSTSQLTDATAKTTVDLPVRSIKPDALELNESTISVTFPEPQALAGVKLQFDAYSARPEMITISADDQVLVQARKYSSDTIAFPFTHVQQITITLQHSQPLRLSELSAVTDGVYDLQKATYRFLAQPAHNYYVYLDGSEQAKEQVSVPEAGQLFSSKTAIVLDTLQFEINPEYVQADTDHDGIGDDVDNCRREANLDQLDANANAIGDACEDFDFDSVVNARDNCPYAANQAQQDTDGDKKGDACDSEESRLTEQYPWLPWAALGVTGVVIASLFVALLKTRTLPYNTKPDDTL